MTNVQDHHARLRVWAKGIHGLEAATELLIRGFDGRLADPGCPWAHPTASGHWIDFDSIPAQMGALPAESNGSCRSPPSTTATTRSTSAAAWPAWIRRLDRSALSHTMNHC